MYHPRPCGCKGQRTCLECSYVYCPMCDLAWPGWETDSWKVHPHHQGEPIRFPGTKIVLDFISEEEERELLTHIDEVPWDPSQSGRRKQNYGPKCNFKKRRVRTETFSGYPSFTKFIQDRFNKVNVLKGFQTVEQCSLDYSLEKGASIDPHIDDCWIWGERIPTLSLLIGSTLTMRKFEGPRTKYNLIDTEGYPAVMREDGIVKEEKEIEMEFRESYQKRNESKKPKENLLKDIEGEKNATPSYSRDGKPYVLRLPMPQRSLLVLYGPARYNWEHGILREDIPSRRVCITYRELTPTYLEYGSKAEVGAEILKASKSFWDHRQHYGLDI
ncbi:Alpha-ketoglutarate-dependent dioxygenase alkB 4-like 2 [Homarus americanus]|uniref:Alpha-ketoglutarate-dependent dioxygenase alkB 4-like 1 n=1 Tax=Homarus americanus TaxID=6706 RepID=A0A8J5MVH8_HOMAM|nr:Alpha-ketoglutarate-dependent dioxygenase alkB 4-like 1 [Homarus americanus]KAG7165186.1 Alpha-ketoglutarate-dependent dioxygenase alkB 4-like 2 [Homarus americanus]